ncbi:MAG: MerR family transcriptional regulator [Proteobacteria bacterium]|nr:MerR family transcriptional regulator [Pseudomonadota bacterium]
MLGAARVKSPDAFRTISEVADELDVPQHVLRFWEGRFSQIKPVKRAGGRRYYRPEDVDLLRGIRALLYVDGFTIKGVQKILREKGLRHVADVGRAEVKAKPKPRSNVISLERGLDREPELPLALASAPARAQPRPAPRKPRDPIAEIERAFAPEPVAEPPIEDDTSAPQELETAIEETESALEIALQPEPVAAEAPIEDIALVESTPEAAAAEPPSMPEDMASADASDVRLEALLAELLELRARLRSRRA